MDKKKSIINDIVEQSGERLIALSHYIHDNPEVGLQEHKAVEAIRALLSTHGVDMEIGIAGLKTAFRATVTGNKPGPHVALLAEYDALEGIGHGCGHNVIATCSTGAFLAVADVIKEMSGKVSLIGCPAEETRGSKCDLVRAGVFDDVDFALMMHPTSGKSIINRSARATTRMTFHFIGKSAHSAIPQDGINALSASIALFNGIDSMRSSFSASYNVNGIILDGGKAANVIPGESTCLFCIRTMTAIQIKELQQKMMRAAEAAAMLVGAKVEIKTDNIIYERYTNLPMSEAFKNNMQALGESMEYADNTRFYGSSDIGNVSVCLPIIHDYLSISQRHTNEHSTEFAEDAASSRADDVCIKGAKGLAMTVSDILNDLELQRSIAEYQKKTVPIEYKEYIK